jgi:hypothetical protein
MSFKYFFRYEFFSVSCAAMGNVPCWREPCMPMRRVVPLHPSREHFFMLPLETDNNDNPLLS